MLAQVPIPAEVPDFTGYGQLGAYLALVVIFLTAGGIVVRLLITYARQWMTTLQGIADACHSQSKAREERFCEVVEKNTKIIGEVMPEVNKTIGQNVQALNTAQSSFSEIHDALKRLNGRRGG